MTNLVYPIIPRDLLPDPPARAIYTSIFDSSIADWPNVAFGGTGALTPAFDNTKAEYLPGSVKLVLGTAIGGFSRIGRAWANVFDSKLGIEVSYFPVTLSGAPVVSISADVYVASGIKHSFIAQVTLSTTGSGQLAYKSGGNTVNLDLLSQIGSWITLKMIIDCATDPLTPTYDSIQWGTNNNPLANAPSNGTSSSFGFSPGINVTLAAGNTLAAAGQINLGHFLLTDYEA